MPGRARDEVPGKMPAQESNMVYAKNPLASEPKTQEAPSVIPCGLKAQPPFKHWCISPCTCCGG